MTTDLIADLEWRGLLKQCSDLDALNARLKAEGVRYASEMIESPVCRMSVILDSEGNSLILHELRSKRAVTT